MSFPLNWITQQICTGYAPKSYEDLDSIREQGIDAIINLCGEYSDLHTIEEEAGFEVYWLPIDDEKAPKMEDMERGLSWLDEAAYLGKKVLIHCNLGIGRTGTFLTAYFLRRGFTLRKTEKLLKSMPASPTNFAQWRILRKFGKKEGKFTLKEPTVENREREDLSYFLGEYQKIINKAEQLRRGENSQNDTLCHFDEKQLDKKLQVIEAVALSERINVDLSAQKREEVVQRASENAQEIGCPLKENQKCLLHSSRPLLCRLQNEHSNKEEIGALYLKIEKLSQQLFSQFFGDIQEELPPEVTLKSSISGKFIQLYFDYLLQQK